jgi:1,4-dihydroxy-2-naphthoyl-CoA hydrolase
MKVSLKGSPSAYLCPMTNEEILAILNERCANTLMETLSIEYTGITEDSLTARMPVTTKHLQPVGLLHGGATVSLAETVGSAASQVFMEEPYSYVAVGQEIAANHLRSARDGFVHATARFLHKGRRSHVLEIRVTDDQGALISFVKMTNAIIERSLKERP